jgi:G3E family GTPase
MIVGGDGKEAHRRRFRTKLISMGMSGYTRVIIEPSGIYDADEFFDVLYDEPLDRWYEIGSVIAVVDAGTTMMLEDTARYLFMSEIAWAGKLIFSKMTEDTDVAGITAFINRTMEDYGCSARYDMEKDIIAKPFDELTGQDLAELKEAGYRKSSYAKLPVEEKQYLPLFYFDVEMQKDQLLSTVKALFADPKAGKVIRVKGFVKVEDDSQLQINATEDKIQLSPVVSSRNVIIIIGENLNKAYINEIWREHCSVVSL